jgi:dTDP-4-dehydrorhamnose reductase
MVNGLRELKPDLVLNLAAYTAVDRAEDEPAFCAAVNATAPAILARETGRLGVPLIHVSTDYVFSGELDRPYREDDATGPINVYGRTKLDGEQAIAAANPAHVIVRASWIISAYRANFVKTMLKLAADRDTLRVIDDQIGGPTSADDLASALLTIINRYGSKDGLAPGIFHFSNEGEASWADLAEAVMAAAASLKGVNARIERISTAEYPTKARRPRNSRLNTKKFHATYGLLARNWHEAVSEIVRDLGGRV